MMVWILDFHPIMCEAITDPNRLVANWSSLLNRWIHLNQHHHHHHPGVLIDHRRRHRWLDFVQQAPQDRVMDVRKLAIDHEMPDFYYQMAQMCQSNLFDVRQLLLLHNSYRMVYSDMVLKRIKENLLFKKNSETCRFFLANLPVKFCGEFDACSICCNDRCIWDDWMFG